MRTFGPAAILCTLALILAPFVASAECPEGAQTQEAPSKEDWEALSEAAYEARGADPPEGHPLASIVEGMTIVDVQTRLGIADDVTTYETGKRWFIPFGSTDAYRTEWRYAGVGRVVFSRESERNRAHVSRIDFNPEETGMRWRGARCGVPAEEADAFAQIRPGMLDSAVRALLGHPDRANSWTTGKVFIPFYFGPDLRRVEWEYEGLGTVRFLWGNEQFRMHVLSASRETSLDP